MRWPPSWLLPVATDPVRRTGRQWGRLEAPAVFNPPWGGGQRGAHRSLGSQLLPLVSVLLKFRVHDFECGQEVAQEEDEERERQHEHLRRGVQGDRGRGGRGRRGREEKVESALVSSLLRHLSGQPHPPPPTHPRPCPLTLQALSTSHWQAAEFPQQKAEIWANCVGRCLLWQPHSIQ